MFELILFVWVLNVLNAPTWCYVLAIIDYALRVARNIADKNKNSYEF